MEVGWLFVFLLIGRAALDYALCNAKLSWYVSTWMLSAIAQSFFVDVVVFQVVFSQV